MEHALDSNLGSDDQLTQEGKHFLLQTAKWARFLAILGFISIAILVIVSFFIGTIMSSVLSTAAGPAEMLSGGFVTVLYLLIAGLYFFPTLYLYNFSTKTIAALSGNGGGNLTYGLRNLKSCLNSLVF